MPENKWRNFTQFESFGDTGPVVVGYGAAEQSYAPVNILITVEKVVQIAKRISLVGRKEFK